MKEIWSKYCFDHSSFISYPFGLFLGSFESPRVSTGIPVTIPNGILVGTGAGQQNLPMGYPCHSLLVTYPSYTHYTQVFSYIEEI
jgi:hypothetical protein